MAKKNSVSYIPRPRPPKRPGRHSKSPNKSYNRKKSRGQGRPG